MKGSGADRLLTWHGDDFSGSTDAMEALERNGVPAVLFLETPTDEEVARFPDVRAIGIAGVSRSQSPEWMREHLPAVFRRLRDIGAPLCHYKVCSTFDSSPSVGSIGCALDIAQETFKSTWVPLVVGAPILRRYTTFGNLFATAEGETHRLDRHPTMSRHPVTPMDESDLRLHLSWQTKKRIGLVDILALESGEADRRLRSVLASGAEVVLFDVLNEASLREVGRLIWGAVMDGTATFSVGSSGLEYALTAWWRTSGEIAAAPSSFTETAADRIVVVSGSCSPVTESQIAWAVNQGFADIPVDATALVSGDEFRIAEVRRAAEEALGLGRSVVIYTARGPSGPMMLREGGNSRDRIGAGLGLLLKQLIDSAGLQRVVVAGGDTSGHAAAQLGIRAIRMLRPLAPGSPLCEVLAGERAVEGLEIVFKGGQVGAPDFFGRVLGVA